MCGILYAENCEREAFEKSLDLMDHRGPDDFGVICFEGRILGQKRLAIVDLNRRSSQPFLASDGKTFIIFNGEIYNYLELKEQFSIHTHTASDTEVLVELFLKLGPNCLQHLNGMFSFLIYNSDTRETFIARDRLGIKPLYWYEQDGKRIFSSEIASVLALLDREPKIDLIGVRQYLKLRTFFREHTLYEGIRMFPAGHYLHNGRLIKYWDLTEAENHDADDETLAALIERAVAYRKLADVETGSYLSGGLDSSIIAAVANKEHTWTVGFSDCNEFEYARMVADAYGFRHHEVLVTRETYRDVARSMIEKRREPLSVPNEVLLFQMTRAVKEHNTVVLSGEGADELFLGYDRIFRWANEAPFSLSDFDALYSYGSHRDDEILEYVLEPVDDIDDNSLKIKTFFQLYHLHGLLRRLDNSTMLCSVEARVPFVDHTLVEYLYRVPFRYKMQDGIVKAPLKRLFGHRLPKAVVDRKKIGFPVPVDDIFQDNKASGMDGWLNFNLETLLGSRWLDVKEQLKIGSSGSSVLLTN